MAATETRARNSSIIRWRQVKNIYIYMYVYQKYLSSAAQRIKYLSSFTNLYVKKGTKNVQSDFFYLSSRILDFIQA